MTFTIPVDWLWSHAWLLLPIGFVTIMFFGLRADIRSGKQREKKRLADNAESEQKQKEQFEALPENWQSIVKTMEKTKKCNRITILEQWIGKQEGVSRFLSIEKIEFVCSYTDSQSEAFKMCSNYGAVILA